MKYVVDASVAIKWVVEEPGTAAAVALLDHSLFAPDLFVPELAKFHGKKFGAAN